jgi:hypothetical protein
MAWLCVINIGYIIARYYKPLWSGKKVLGADIWFLVNFVVYLRLFVIVLIVDIITVPYSPVAYSRFCYVVFAVSFVTCCLAISYILPLPEQISGLGHCGHLRYVRE